MLDEIKMNWVGFFVLFCFVLVILTSDILGLVLCLKCYLKFLSNVFLS